MLFNLNDVIISEEGVTMEYKVGDIIIVYVTGIEKYGIFINADNDYNGLIHISEISESFVRNINDYVKVGEKIKAKILEIDEAKKQLHLSIKNLDYRISRVKKTRIVETKNGFNNLGKQLNVWIEEKQLEIEQQNAKN